jgi:hypothetical protein
MRVSLTLAFNGTGYTKVFVDMDMDMEYGYAWEL